MDTRLFSLENKTVVVIGGAGYLGSATVRAMLSLGAKVAVADIFPDYTLPYVEDFKDNPNCLLVKCDTSCAEGLRTAFDACVAHFGGFNAMVNLMNRNKLTGLENTSDEDWAFGIDGVLGSCFRAIREVIPYFKKNGGVIVNTASMYGMVSADYRIYGESGQNSPPVYAAGKAGVINLTRYSAAHLAPKGIRVNCVTPGPFPNSLKLPPEEFLKELRGKTMLGRVGRAEEIAGAYIYLISDMSTFTTGHNLVVDGGWTAW